MVGRSRGVGWGRGVAVGGSGVAISWSWGVAVGWGRGVAIGRSRGVAVGWGVTVGFWVLSLAFVGHLGHVTGVAVHVVSNSLHAAVGKQHLVGALGVVTVTGLLSTEVVAAVVVLDGVLGAVLGRGLRRAGGKELETHQTTDLPATQRM